MSLRRYTRPVDRLPVTTESTIDSTEASVDSVTRWSYALQGENEFSRELSFTFTLYRG